MFTLPMYRFVRVPTQTLEALYIAPLTGSQLKIVLWIIRNTFGWNRESTRFSWYRIARSINTDRAAVYRAGMQLREMNIIKIHDARITIQLDSGKWTPRPRSRERCPTDAPRHRTGSRQTSNS